MFTHFVFQASEADWVGVSLCGKGPADLDNDDTVGFQVISTDDIDDLGIPEIINRIRARVGDTPVYLRSVVSLYSKNSPPDDFLV